MATIPAAANGSNGAAEAGEATSSPKPRVIGVMGGAFNPIHLGHVLLAVTVKETKPVDEVVLVPVFRHPVKKDLLPFEDRLTMCQLSVRGKGINVSNVEQVVGESNVAMLQGLKRQYDGPVQLLWVCGDDVFEWIDNPKGQAMMKELHGLIVQQRLHRGGENENSFYKSPVNSNKIMALSALHDLRIDIIFGELPHFSSTLVRSSPASWKAYLPTSVAEYLDQRPHLLATLVEGAAEEAPDEAEPAAKRLRSDLGLFSKVTPTSEKEVVTTTLMACIALVHRLQSERGRTALALSLGNNERIEDLREVRKDVDKLLQRLPPAPKKGTAAEAMAQELVYTHSWLSRDRASLDLQIQKAKAAVDHHDGGAPWLQRARLLDKITARINVLLELCTQVLAEQVDGLPREGAACPRDAKAVDASQVWCSRQEDIDTPETHSEALLRLFRLWSRGKEALGFERAFVCAGGSEARSTVRKSLAARSRLTEVIEHKERCLRNIYSAENASPSASHETDGTSQALHAMLTRITALEWSLMNCFAASTPLQVVHDTLANDLLISAAGDAVGRAFDVDGWFTATSSAVDLMKQVIQGLAAAITALTPA